MVKLNSSPNKFLPCLQPLKENEQIVITKPDKGNGVVLLNTKDYLDKLSNIVNDRSKFKQITTNTATHLLKLEDKLNRILRSIKSSLPDQIYNFLSASGSVPGRLYGLPKIHKPGNPLRPIISAIGTFNHNLSKFLVPIISPLTTNSYTIDNSTSFIKEVTSLTFDHPITLASFDIGSLFIMYFIRNH